jgi:hypothetical protein
MSPQNCQKLENLLGNIKIFLAQNPIFLAQNPIFLNGFPTFVNGFLLCSSMAFCFPQQLSAFLNGFPIFLDGFPLSKKSEKIYLRDLGRMANLKLVDKRGKELVELKLQVLA